MDGRDRLAAVLAVGVLDVGVGAHGAGPVERQHRGDVLEVVGLHRAQQRAHRATVELEHAQRVAARQQLVGLGVVEPDLLEHHSLAPVGLDVFEAVVEDGEVAQAEEVHLQQPERLAGAHVELRDDRAVLLAALDGDDVEERVAREDHARGVHPPLALEPFEAARGVDDLLDLVLGLVEQAELARLGIAAVLRIEDAGQRDVFAHDRWRHRLRDAVAQRERKAEHARRVFDGLLGLDRAVGDDLRDPRLAVLLGRVTDHVAAPALVEVHVDVGHGHPLRVEEPLEQQPMDERVELGDAKRERHQAPRRRPPARADPDAALLQQPVDLAGRAAGRGDQPFAVGLQQLAVEPRLVVIALEARQRGQPEQVVHALGRLGEESHVGVHLAGVLVVA